MHQSQKTTKSKFLRISCPRCRKIKILFGKSSSFVKCEKCNYLLIKPTGGKSKIRAFISRVIWRK